VAARNSDPQRRGLFGKRFYPQILLRNRKEEASEQIDKKLAARNRRGKGLLSHLEGRIEALEKAGAKKPDKKAAKKKK